MEPRQHATRHGIDQVGNLLGYLDDAQEPSQDWDLILADHSRVHEFCDLYDASELDNETRFALMQVIVASCDDALHDCADDADRRVICQRVEDLLRRDFVLHQHTIEAWACLDPVSQPYLITPLMRRLWD
jgi:hypothetical protein